MKRVLCWPSITTERLAFAAPFFEPDCLHFKWIGSQWICFINIANFFVGEGETTSFLSAKHGFSFVAVSMSFPRLRSNRFKSNGNFMAFLLFMLRKSSHLFNAAGRDACIGESGLNSYSPVGWWGPHTHSPTAGGVWLSETPLMGELLECWTSPAECWC